MKSEPRINDYLAEAWNKRREGEYYEARNLIKTAAAICQKDNHSALGRIFHIKMQLEVDQENLEEALHFNRQSLQYYQLSGNDNKIAHSMRHLADLCSRMGKDSEAERYYRKVIKIYRSSLDTHDGDLANALRGFGVLLVKRKQTNEAILIWTEVKGLYDSLGLSEGFNEANENLELLRFVKD